MSLPTRCEDTGHGAVPESEWQRSPKSPIRPRNPPSIGARYNQKSIGLALRLREC
ncbi:hypothetical protein [Microcoleus sp. herbarium2]|uniref:hypothetical protein n=1 Tax=Microcoleus sp. herbarium2 TaxID=3055433 RepID=UPI002FCF66BB